MDILTIVSLVVGTVCLVFGAEWLVRTTVALWSEAHILPIPGSKSLAHYRNIPVASPIESRLEVPPP